MLIRYEHFTEFEAFRADITRRAVGKRVREEAKEDAPEGKRVVSACSAKGNGLPDFLGISCGKKP